MKGRKLTPAQCEMCIKIGSEIAMSERSFKEEDGKNV
jgi:hypothetical protein